MIACNKKDITSPHDAQSSVIVELVNSTGNTVITSSSHVPCLIRVVSKVSLLYPSDTRLLGACCWGCLFMFHTGLYLLFSQ